jgi:hypothetical protein
MVSWSMSVAGISMAGADDEEAALAAFFEGAAVTAGGL